MLLACLLRIIREGLADAMRLSVMLVMTAADYSSFAEALRRKLLQELAPAPTASR